ncbi:MAG: response regulator transcription factor [Oscillospiraceae bacterium]|jgi:DNA-binding response OmpR family regulator|nr:response regulator transcription factor [Oscillospiraceae bacterium]
MKLLIVDDEEVLVKGLKFNFQNEGYDVDTANNGETAVTLARANNYAAIILDYMMPGLDGLSACQKIREFSTVPIVILTARGESSDKLVGFESGADDYVTKPFNTLELKARIRALIRRSNLAAQNSPVISEDGISVDADGKNAYRDGQLVELTLREFEILELLYNNPGKVYSRDSLLDIIWNTQFAADVRTVDVHIRRLREKLEENPAEPKNIMTKWGAGYYFAR